MGRKRVCGSCGMPLVQPETGRPRVYCSAACRQRAHAARRARRPVRNDWHTPSHIREQVLSRWPVKLDAAATAESALVADYLGPDHHDPDRRDALALDHWHGLAGDGVAWVNPPYVPAAFLSEFLSRAAATAQAGTSVVGLVPASTGARWWWDNIIDQGAHVEFLRGRLAFEGPHATGRTSAPWPSALVIWDGGSRSIGEGRAARSRA